LPATPAIAQRDNSPACAAHSHEPGGARRISTRKNYR
jgi:hypothetical protein